MWCRKIVRLFCSDSVSKSIQMLRKLQVVQVENEDLTAKLKEIEEEVKYKQKQLNVRNQQIHELRVQMTQDIEKGDKVRAEAKKKSAAHRAEAIQNFAEGLIKICPSLEQIHESQKETHSTQFIELKEGFDLTSRLFFSTLEKYKIHKVKGEVGQKFDPQLMEVTEKEQTEEKQKKNTVAEVVEDGWKAEGKVIHKLKVKLFT